jgi:hypothetical protein
MQSWCHGIYKRVHNYTSGFKITTPKGGIVAEGRLPDKKCVDDMAVVWDLTKVRTN